MNALEMSKQTNDDGKEQSNAVSPEQFSIEKDYSTKH